ncbi:MAG: guanylate kinase [Clostridia bacterium]
MKGNLIVISGPSGAGKGTVLKLALEKSSSLKYSISVTTRKPRTGEQNGVNYFFKTIEECETMVHNHEFLEYQYVYDNFYGTPKKNVMELLDAGYDVVLEIDVKGAMSIKSIYDDAILIFLTPKDRATLLQRLVGRGTETKEQLNLRIEAAYNEFNQIDKYDYVIVNENAVECALNILKIVEVEKFRVKNNKILIENIIRR